VTDAQRHAQAQFDRAYPERAAKRDPNAPRICHHCDRRAYIEWGGVPVCDRHVGNDGWSADARRMAEASRRARTG
jgi:hypothetical protein